jgi:hypothetical protein
VTLHGSETAVPFVDANQFLLNQRLSKIWLMPAFNGICDVEAVNTFNSASKLNVQRGTDRRTAVLVKRSRQIPKGDCEISG